MQRRAERRRGTGGQGQRRETSFLSRMSHDIRTPLNGIIGLIAIDDAHPGDLALITANRVKMKIAANHLLSLINDVLQMSKLESGEVALSHEPLDLNRLSRDILTIVEQRAAEEGVTLEYDREQPERVKIAAYTEARFTFDRFFSTYTATASSITNPAAA